MVLSCAAYGCSSHNKMKHKPKFFRFPNNDMKLRKKWIQACKRVNKDGTPWNPKGPNVYLCGKHFYTGQAEKKDPNHPDYIPSIFQFKQNPSKEKSRMSRYSRYKRQQEKNSVLSEKPHSVESLNKKETPTFCSNDVPLNEENSMDFVVENLNERDNDKSNDISVTENIDQSISERNTITEMFNLRKERDAALSKLEELRKKFLLYENLPTEKFKYYTGIVKERFDEVYVYMEQFLPNICRSKLSLKNQMFMVMIKLRLDIPIEQLADQFQISKSSFGSIFKKWIDLFYNKLSFLIHWPDHDASIRTIPNTFKQYFPRLTAIIDCTEIFIARPANLKARAQVYSNYKKHSTTKFLIACTPLGSISFVSKAWGGRVSDNELVKESGLISYKLHHPGDQILADRGFTLIDEFAAGCGVELIIPAFTKGKSQLSAKEVEVSRQIATVRIHIERVIGLVKNRYKILDGTISTNVLQSISGQASESDVTNIDKLFTVCCCFVNLGDGIVYNEK